MGSKASKAKKKEKADAAAAAAVAGGAGGTTEPASASPADSNSKANNNNNNNNANNANNSGNPDEIIGLLTIKIRSGRQIPHEKSPFVAVEFGRSGFRSSSVTQVGTEKSNDGVCNWDEEIRVWVREGERNFTLGVALHDNKSMMDNVKHGVEGVAHWLVASAKGLVKDPYDGAKEEGLSGLFGGVGRAFRDMFTVNIEEAKKWPEDKVIGTGFLSISKYLDFQTHSVDVDINKAKGTILDKNLEGKEASTHDPNHKGPVVSLDLHFLPKEQVVTFYKKMMAEIDTDGNMQLNDVEFTALLASLGVQYTDEQQDALFKKMDTNNSGSICEDELIAFLLSDEFSSEPMSVHLLSYIIDGEVGTHRVVSGMFDVIVPGGGDGDVTTDDDNTSRAGIAVINHGHAFIGSRRHDFSLAIMDRKSGLIVQEFIPQVIKTSIQLMYRHGAGQKLTELHKIRKLLKAMSVKEGKHMDTPESKKNIPQFIKQHKLNVSEMLVEVKDYETFNQFFYRKLKPSARPISNVDDDSVCVSPADCRMMVFPTITEATKMWIKGDQFTVEHFLNNKDLAQDYMEGSLVIARLAPQDYHRFHVPVTCEVGDSTPIDGTLFTVNPFAIREKHINVYTQNKRVVNVLKTKEFGDVISVSVGATMVGSIHITAEKGAHLKKGDEHGYFAFGGSTVVLIFKKDKIEFDGDLLKNSSMPIETLIRVGDRIGKALAPKDE